LQMVSHFHSLSLLSICWWLWGNHSSHRTPITLEFRSTQLQFGRRVLAPTVDKVVKLILSDNTDQKTVIKVRKLVPSESERPTR
jgi:hypothetical protein